MKKNSSTLFIFRITMTHSQLESAMKRISNVHLYCFQHTDLFTWYCLFI